MATRLIKEPVAEDPVAEDPVAEDPVAEDPVAEEPVAEEPVAEEPVAEEPAVEESTPTIYTALTPILHDGEEYQKGDSLILPNKKAVQLLALGAIELQ